MNKMYKSASLLLVCCTLTACSTSQPAAAPAPTTTNQSNVTTNDTSANSSNSSLNGTTVTNTLSAFAPAATYGIHVDTPSGWTISPIHGGDYTGWKLTNPNDSNQQISIVTSGCVGCSTASDGSHQAKLIIPEQNAKVTATNDNGYSVNYGFSQANNPNSGVGIATVSHNATGYAYVEALLPPSNSTMATQIVSSFQLSR